MSFPWVKGTVLEYFDLQNLGTQFSLKLASGATRLSLESHTDLVTKVCGKGYQEVKSGLVDACRFYVLCGVVSYTGIIIELGESYRKGAIQVLYQSHSF